MPKVVRPWLTTGLAIVGVAAGSAVPLPTLPKSDVRVENTAARVDAVSSPIQYYPEVLQRSLTNAHSLLDEYLADPLPVVRAIADTQNQSFTEVVDAAVALDPVAFTHAVVATVGRPTASAARVVGSGEPFATAGSMMVRLTVPAVSGVLAAGTALSDVAQAGSDLDVVHGVSALINVPGRVADGVLNGQVDGQHEQYFGLLGSVVEAPVSDEISGPVDYLIRSLHGIGDTISSPGQHTVPAAEGVAGPDLTGARADASGAGGGDPGPGGEDHTTTSDHRTGAEPTPTEHGDDADDAPTSESAQPAKPSKPAKHTKTPKPSKASKPAKAATDDPSAGESSKGGTTTN